MTAERVGETIIRSGSKSFKVSVTGKYNTFKEPYTQWGASQSAVKSYMTGYTLFKETNEVLYYTGLNKEMGYGYSFTNSALSSSYVILQMTSVTSDEMVAYLAERYVYVTMDEDDYYFGFVTPDKKTIVILQLQSNSGQLYYFVYYTSASSANAAPTSTSTATAKIKISLVVMSFASSSLLPYEPPLHRKRNVNYFWRSVQS